MGLIDIECNQQLPIQLYLTTNLNIYYLNKDSWFKYLLQKKRFGNGLFTRDLAIHNTELIYNCPSFNSDRNSTCSNKAFFITPYLEDKKEKAKIHHNDILEIFHKWCQIQLSVSTEKKSYYTTSIPLYVDLMEQIEASDRYSEGRSHLLSGYKNSFQIQERIRDLQTKHNQQVSDFMQQAETHIQKLQAIMI